MLLKTSQLQCSDVCDDEDYTSDSPPTMSRSHTSSVPDITRRQPMATIYSRQAALDGSDPYGPMSGRNLVSIVDDLHEQLSVTDSYMAPHSHSHSTPRLRYRHTYHTPVSSYCDVHCHGKHTPHDISLSKTRGDQETH